MTLFYQLLFFIAHLSLFFIHLLFHPLISNPFEQFSNQVLCFLFSFLNLHSTFLIDDFQFFNHLFPFVYLEYPIFTHQFYLVMTWLLSLLFHYILLPQVSTNPRPPLIFSHIFISINHKTWENLKFLISKVKSYADILRSLKHLIYCNFTTIHRFHFIFS